MPKIIRILAWEKAYEYIANVFIEIEKDLYEQAKAQEGGWEGFREFVVDKKVKESDVITSFYLKPADGKTIATFQPGQYLTLKAKIPGETYTHIRHYSLSDAPGKDYYRISVKREDARDRNQPESYPITSISISRRGTIWNLAPRLATSFWIPKQRIRLC
ncbi:hypothetical protein [Thermoflavimicrobium dichotomicum]|uniref:Nitric oxide dioxygenase n=1 Tax=Thermoflavimicrobium dichotomicum TaxID=46223 RepID=A0A1I3V3L3_9BACL|nr:hypothetical protein [Thermoflavimicrobium dichotomicum]SFJ90244.1 nitric oxide dioxygenase [Thermoflavimicrobium dichotomicum]